MGARIVMIVATATVIGAPISAQERSQVNELIDRARAALDDLQYERADSIAQDLLRLGDAVSEQVRVVAHAIAAAALYPEEQFFQQTDNALARLRQLVRLAPDARIPGEISWRGLDSLLETARRTTFAVRVEPRTERLQVGLDGATIFDVMATRPVDVSMRLRAAGREDVVLDTIRSAAEGELQIFPADDRWREIESGEYLLSVFAHDVESGEEVETTFRASVEAPPLVLLTVPQTFDESTLLPEETQPGRGKNALIGLGLGAATALTASAFRASSPVGDVSGDGRAYAVAGAMTVGALIGALVERPKPLPQNIAHNARLRADFAEHVRDTEVENTRRRGAYRVSVELQGAVPR